VTEKDEMFLATDSQGAKDWQKLSSMTQSRSGTVFFQFSLRKTKALCGMPKLLLPVSMIAGKVPLLSRYSSLP